MGNPRYKSSRIMKSRLSIFVVVVILLAIPLVACSKAAPETVEDILSQAADVALVKYDCVWPTRSGIHRVWVKDNMMRIEYIQQGQTVETYLLDMEAKTSYWWKPPENKPSESVSPGELADFVSAMGMASAAASLNPRIIGTEITDGKECYLVECVSGEITIRAWIWKKHKFLVRNDLIGAEHTVTIEFKNIDFGNIPDSMFELPEVP
jgi:outer membrane lipoprotein-sorting protein